METTRQEQVKSGMQFQVELFSAQMGFWPGIRGTHNMQVLLLEIFCCSQQDSCPGPLACNEQPQPCLPCYAGPSHGAERPLSSSTLPGNHHSGAACSQHQKYPHLAHLWDGSFTARLNEVKFHSAIGAAAQLRGPVLTCQLSLAGRPVHSCRFLEGAA